MRDRRRRRAWRVLAVVAVAALASLVTTACAQEGDTSPTTTASAAGTTFTARLRMSGDPARQQFRDVGADGSVRYGLGTLSGATELAGRPVQMEAEYALDYVDGTGPFRGYWTVTWPGGELLAFTYEGTTTATGDRSTIAGDLEVLGGTGAYAAVTGDGKVRAVRSGPVGSPVDYDVELRLDGMP